MSVLSISGAEPDRVGDADIRRIQFNLRQAASAINHTSAVLDVLQQEHARLSGISPTERDLDVVLGEIDYHDDNNALVAEFPYEVELLSGAGRIVGELTGELRVIAARHCDA